jgi:hypothetical protein
MSTCSSSSKKSIALVEAGEPHSLSCSMLILSPCSVFLPATRSQTCNPALDEALESAEVDFYPSNSTSTKSFISDHLQSMDFCENPDLLRLVC